MKEKLLSIMCLAAFGTVGAQVTVSPANTTICAGEVQQLTATGGGAPGTSTLFSENFEGGTLGNFTATVISGTVNTNSQWTNRTSPYATTTTVWTPVINSGSKFALSNSDYNGANVNTALESGVLNTTGYTSLSLTFRQFYSDYSATNDFAYVEVSVNGAEWTTVQTYTTNQGSAANFSTATVSLNDYLNQGNFRFRLRYKATWNDGWAVDDVVVSGTSVAVASYTWSPVAGLYTDAGATVPYTGTVTASVFAKPSQTTTYTASYSSGGDTFSGQALITVNTVEAPMFEDDAPVLCSATQLNLIAPPDVDVVWYTAATGGTVLPGTTVVSDGTYYAAQVAGGCESTARTQVNVTINIVDPPTGDAVQSFCNEGTVGDLEAEGVSLWYDAASGGNILPANTPLTNEGMYYAERSQDGCVSSERLPVQALLSFAMLETPENVSACDAYVLPELEYGHYFTQSGGTGDMLAEGAAVTEDMTLFIYADDFSNPECIAEVWFEIFIHSAGTLSGEQQQTISVGTADEATVADLVVEAEGGGYILWYYTLADALAGENPVSVEEQLVDGHEYFAMLTLDDCTSPPYGVTANVVLGSEDFGANAFVVHPNPVTDKLVISGQAEISSVKVANMLGQQVYESKPSATGTTVNMSHFPAGTYLVTIYAANAQKAIKIIKQ